MVKNGSPEFENFAGTDATLGGEAQLSEPYITPIAVPLGDAATSTLGGQKGDDPERFVDDWYFESNN